MNRLAEGSCRLAAFALITVCPAALGAQSNSEVQEAWNYAVPESPALVFLGDGAGTVSRPLSARDLGTQLVNAIDSGGHVRQGVALEFTPYYIARRRISLTDYQDHSKVAAYALANTQVSLATVRSSGDNASTDIAFGLRSVLFDESDPMRSTAFTATLDSLMGTCEPKEPPISSNMTGPGDSTRIAQEFEACAAPLVSIAQENWLRGHWNSSSFGLGIASGLGLPDSRIENSHWSGLAAWIAGSLKVSGSGLLTGQLEVDHRKGANGAEGQTTLKQGGRLIFGSAKLNLFAEVNTSARIGGSKADTPGQWTGGVEFKAAENLWIATGFGSRFATDENDRVLLVANLRWVISKNSRFSPQ